MNIETEAFLEELKKNPQVRSVILFGSQARGNAREDSDVDLIVVCNETKRGVEERNGQSFELVYVTEEDAKKYYLQNKDNAVRTWKVAKILYDSDKSAYRLKTLVEEIAEQGKLPISDEKLIHLKFDTEDFIRAVRTTKKQNIAQAQYLLNLKLLNLLELYFDIKAIWKPAPKQLLGEIKELDADLFTVVSDFYEEFEVDKKLSILESISHRIFI